MSLNITDLNKFKNLDFVIRLLQQQHDLLLNRQLATPYHRTIFTICVCTWWGVRIEQTINVNISVEIFKQRTQDFQLPTIKSKTACW